MSSLHDSATVSRMSRRRIWGRLNRPRPRVLAEDALVYPLSPLSKVAGNTMCTTEKKRIVLYSEEPQRLRKKNYAYYHLVLVHIIYIRIQRSYNILHTIGTSKLDCCETTTYLRDSWKSAGNECLYIVCLYYNIILWYYRHIDNKIMVLLPIHI